jgi:hypothetical protein
MAEIVNLRMARKRAKREKSSQVATEHRLAYGVTSDQRIRGEAEREKAKRTLDSHRIDRGDR